MIQTLGVFQSQFLLSKRNWAVLALASRNRWHLSLSPWSAFLSQEADGETSLSNKMVKMIRASIKMKVKGPSFEALKGSSLPVASCKGSLDFPAVPPQRS